MKIGLLSDTHSFLDPKVLNYFEPCDEIWHAGDIGDMAVAETLEKFRPLRAVSGNIDDRSMQNRFPEDLRFLCEEISVLMTHIGGVPPHYNTRVKKELALNRPDLFICGHSHILQIRRDVTQNNMLFLNPGAAGNHGFHRIKTLLRFEVIGKEIRGMELIELGLRGVVGNL